MVAPDIQQAIEQVGATREEIAKGEEEFVRMRAETLKFRREAERLPVRVKIPKRELLAGGLKERRERRIALLGRKRLKEKTLREVRREEQAITKEELLFQEQVAPVRAQLAITDVQIKEGLEWELAEKYERKDRFPFFEPKSVQRKWAMIQKSKKDVITFEPIREIIPPAKRIPLGTRFLQPDKPKKSFWEPFGRVIKSVPLPPFQRFFKGRTFSPPALTSHVAGMRVPIVSGSPSSLLPQEAHTIPHLESAGTQPIFTVGNTRNPRTWMNKDPIPPSKRIPSGTKFLQPDKSVKQLPTRERVIKKIREISRMPKVIAVGIPETFARFGREGLKRKKEIQKLRSLPSIEYQKKFPITPAVMDLPPEQKFVRQKIDPLIAKAQAGQISASQFERLQQIEGKKYVAEEIKKRAETLRLREKYKVGRLEKYEPVLVKKLFKGVGGEDFWGSTPKETMKMIETARLKVPVKVRPPPIYTEVLAYPIGMAKETARILEREPVSTIGTAVAIGFAFPYVRYGLGAFKPVISKFAVSTAPYGIQTLPLAQATAPAFVRFTPAVIYGGLKVREMYGAPTSVEKGQVLGRAGVELVSLGLGAYAGEKTLSKTVGWFTTAGREHIPVEKVVHKQVLEGGKTIPTEPPRKHVPIFKKGKQFWHATPEAFTKYETFPGLRELPGLYGAPKASPHFLRIPGTLKPYQKTPLSLFGKYEAPGRKPTLMLFEDLKFRYSPTKYMGKGFDPLAPEIKYKFLKPAKKGYAEVPAIKSEIEALIRPGTKFELVSQKYYTEWKGVRVPIDIFKVTGVSKPPQIPTTPAISPKFLGTPSYSPAYYPGKMPIISEVSSGLGLTTIAPRTSILAPTTPSIISYPSRPTTPIPPTTPLRPTTLLRPTTPITPYYPGTPTPPISPSEIIETKRLKEDLFKVPGFRIFVKRKGKRVFLEGVFPRGEAIRRGARQTRRTLRATFGIVEAGAIPRRRRAPAFLPSPRIFRTYQIIKGKRVPLKDTWIQKAPYRLSARTEVKEIQVARKTRKGGRKVRWL